MSTTQSRVPAIGNGMDVQAVMGVVTTMFLPRLQAQLANLEVAFDFDTDEMVGRLAELPSEPDEELR